MKKTTKLLTVLSAGLLCISAASAMPAYAEDSAPVSVTVEPDKDAYSKGDSLKFSVSVSNAGDSEISDIALRASLPEKFTISENGEFTLSLAANETKTIVVAAEPAAEETTAPPTTTAEQNTTAAQETTAQETTVQETTTAQSTTAVQNTSGTAKTSVSGPKTGDTQPYILMLLLGAAAVAALKSRKSRKVFSVMISVTLLGTLTMQSFTVLTDADSSRNTTATAEFRYDGITETITVEAVYEYDPAGEENTGAQVLDYNKQALRDVTGVSNARQLGGYINKDGRKIKQNVLLRTGNLAHITENGIAALQNKYKVSDIIDMRYERELNPNTIDKEIEGIQHHNIPMSATKDAAEQVFSQNPDLYAKMQELQRNAGKPGGSMALSMFQAEVGVISVQKHIEYFESDEAAGYYRDVFEILLNKPEDAAVLFHCAGGKDRTGMISMLILAALDFDKDIMMQDYMMSNTANAAKIEETRAAAEEYTDDPDLRYNIIYTAAVYEEVMETNINDLTEQYGSVKNFLREKVGLTDEDFAKLEQLYLED